MSEDKIFFDEKVLSIVDSWLGGSDSKSKSTTSTSSTAAPVSKVGLGFRGSKKEEKVKDALQVRLDKNQKKKNNDKADDESNKRKLDNDNNDDDDDDDDLQLHGIVEDMPKSRTQQYSKPIKVVSKQPKKKIAVEKKEGKEENESHAATAVASVTSSSSTSSNTANNASNSSVNSSANSSANNGEKKSGKHGHWAPIVPSSSTEGGDEKRKRTKTRSKQKNIRRDNRPDSQKPSYITNTDAEDYRGREMTEETRMRMGKII